MSTKTYTTTQVAKFTHRSDSAISNIIRKGQLKAEVGKTRSGRKTWLITGEKEELIALVHRLMPKGGYRKNVAPAKKGKTPSNLQQVLDFMELTEEKRSLLLELGDRATEDTITLLLGLV